MTANPDIDAYFRAVNFLTGAQIYLRDNVLLLDPLQPEHFKDRLLGHWGTCPGINLVYAHLNRIIRRDDRDAILITGPGHGAPANLANLYLEGSLAEFYPELTHDLSGVSKFVKAFSWPGGFPSHLYPGVPGTIHEGGELGYALATAFGAAFDNPDLLVACIVGDGEAETGPTAAAWHSPKFLDPRESGAVLPILHLNSYKISNPTIYGMMSDDELVSLFTGFGWDPILVDQPDLMRRMGEGTDEALEKIDALQRSFRSGSADGPPRWPLILLRSPKGWTGVEEVDGEPVEGCFRAHQVPVGNVRDDKEHLALVEEWLRSYRPEELFTEEGAPVESVRQCCPAGDRRMGMNPHTFGGRMRRPLDLPDWRDYEVETKKGRGRTEASPMKTVAAFLRDVIDRNRSTFRIVSPDELDSNKLTGVFEAPTQRNFQWPLESDDQVENIGHEGGRVLEILSEHTCQGWLQGYLLTGRHGLFPSYESFLPIVASMMDQFAKFLKISMEFPWREPVPSLNYLESSTLWRQEHNGFSHQNPGFINTLLNKKGNIMRVYLPPDPNCLLSTMNHCLAGVNHVNLVIASKRDTPSWLSAEEAENHCRAGASVWPWASSHDGVDPDVVLVGIGDVPTQEVLAAADILHREEPALRFRVVNVTDLLILEEESEHPHGLDDTLFRALFTDHAPVVINFHGYPSAVKQLLFGRGLGPRLQINGYVEEGNTTTPFDMLVRNGASRYHLVAQALRAAASRNDAVAATVSERVHHYEYLVRAFQDEIRETGKDPDEITGWKWER